MPIITLAEAKSYLSIDSADYNTAISILIPAVTERLRILCNRTFTVQPIRQTVRFDPRDVDYYRFGRDSSLYILSQVNASFEATAKTVTARASNFASAGFAAGQDFLVFGSYLNDGYYEIDSVSTSALTILSAYSFSGAAAGTHEFKAEATGASIFFAVATWPRDIKPIVASMIQYDYQERGQYKDTEGSQALGEYGYPQSILRALVDYTEPSFGYNFR
jgi:hypothetical protein